LSALKLYESRIESLLRQFKNAPKLKTLIVDFSKLEPRPTLTPLLTNTTSLKKLVLHHVASDFNGVKFLDLFPGQTTIEHLDIKMDRIKRDPSGKEMPVFNSPPNKKLKVLKLTGNPAFQKQKGNAFGGEEWG
jgi:hypothetical protein